LNNVSVFFDRMKVPIYLGN